MTRIKRELVAAGYHGEVLDFYRAVAGLLRQLHPGWTDERLKRHPRRALVFCDRVREFLSSPRLDDPLIMGALENARKRAKSHESN